MSKYFICKTLFIGAGYKIKKFLDKIYSKLFKIAIKYNRSNPFAPTELQTVYFIVMWHILVKSLKTILSIKFCQITTILTSWLQTQLTGVLNPLCPAWRFTYPQELARIIFNIQKKITFLTSSMCKRSEAFGLCWLF